MNITRKFEANGYLDYTVEIMTGSLLKGKEACLSQSFWSAIHCLIFGEVNSLSVFFATIGWSPIWELSTMKVFKQTHCYLVWHTPPLNVVYSLLAAILEAVSNQYEFNKSKFAVIFTQKPQSIFYFSNCFNHLLSNMK